MAWEARLGLKRCYHVGMADVCMGLNGLGSPSGIETEDEGIVRVLNAAAKWPGKPVWD